MSESLRECPSVDLEARERLLLSMLQRLSHHLDQSLAPYLKSRLPVDDLVQETFVRAWESLSDLRSDSEHAMFAWLKRIAHRLTIDHIRRKSPIANASPLDSQIMHYLAHSEWLSPSHNCSHDELKRITCLSLAHLESVHRTVLQLRYVDEKTFVEIGDQLGQSSAAVRGLHRNATRKLRAFLGHASWYFSS